MLVEGRCDNAETFIPNPVVRNVERGDNLVLHQHIFQVSTCLQADPVPVEAIMVRNGKHGEGSVRLQRSED